MNIGINFSSNLLMGRQNGMLKSTQDKLQRQADRDGKIAFFEAQKENLKNMKSLNLDDISRKLDMLHSYNDEIVAAKQEYNSSQMFHAMDEAKERAEKIAKEAEKNKPKTEEERKEDAIDEALGTDDNKGVLTEVMDKLSEVIDESIENVDNMQDSQEDVNNLAQESIKQKDLQQGDLQNQDLQQGATQTQLQKAYINEKYVPIDVKV
jgi:vacuolar-type H+-ATPase subunit I/STV1